MYTRCPHCTTIFRVTAEQLRTAHSEISCVTCGELFSALESLSDDITTLLAAAPPVSDSDIESPDPDPETNTAPIDPDFADTIHRDEIIADDTDISATINAEALIKAEDEKEEDDDTNEQADDSTQDAEDHLDDDLADDLSEDLTDDLNGIPEKPAADDETSIESMEFDAPEQTWTTFFLNNNAANSADNDDRESIVEAEADSESSAVEFDIDDDPISKIQLGHSDLDTNGDENRFEFQTSNQDEWQNLLGELTDDAATPAADACEDEQVEDEPIEDEQFEAEHTESNQAGAEEDDNEIPIIPAWLSDEIPAEAADQNRVFQFSWSVLGICAALALLLAGQLIHYNRDSLAANEIYGATVRKTYALLGAQLYPNWPLDAFDITGTEAITGRSSPGALDILANVIVSGRQPIGLPLIRVELHDRWSNPVASRIFTPVEYLHDFDPKILLINPGTALPVDISVTDPGAEALGYVVDVCLPRRKTGLECQIAKDPFQ